MDEWVNLEFSVVRIIFIKFTLKVDRRNSQAKQKGEMLGCSKIIVKSIYTHYERGKT